MKAAKLTAIATLIGLSSLSMAAENIESLYQKALNHDSSVKISELNHQNAQSQVRSGLGRLLPSINSEMRAGLATEMVVAGIDKNGRVIVDTAEDAFQYNTDQTSLSASITAQQAVFNWQAIAGYQLGLINADMNGLQILVAKQQLMLGVAQSYIDVLRAQEALSLSQKEEKSVARQLDQTKERFKVGLVAITDVHNAQASFDQTRAARLGAESQLDIARLQLEILTGSTEELSAINADVLLSKPLINDVGYWADLAAKNSLAIQSSEMAMQIAAKNVEVNKALRYPTVGAQASYSVSSNDAGDNWSDNSSIGISISIPLYSGGQTSASIEQAVYSEIENELKLEKAKRDTRVSILQLYRTLETNLATIEAQKQAIISRESALKATEVGLDVGTQTVVDVLAAQSALYAAQKQLADTRYDYLLNQLRLKQAAGTLAMSDLSELTK